MAGESSASSQVIFTEHGGKEITLTNNECDVLSYSSVPNIPSISNVIRISDDAMKVFWVPLTPDEARGVLTELQIAYQPSRNSRCTSLEEDDMQLMTIMENIDTQSVAVIDGLVASEEYCVGIQVSTTAGESGYSNTIKAQRKLYYANKLIDIMIAQSISTIFALL